MAVTPTDIKLRFPEFNYIDDSRIQLFIDEATATVNPNCPNSDLMISYLTAHLLNVSEGTDSGDSSNVAPVSSRSVGDVSESFGIDTSSNSGDDFYKSTAYGQRFLDLRSNCIGRPIIC